MTFDYLAYCRRRLAEFEHLHRGAFANWRPLFAGQVDYYRREIERLEGKQEQAEPRAQEHAGQLGLFDQ